MMDPALAAIRKAKAELIEKLRGHSDFAGAGIGSHEGRLVLKVNWRILPAESDLPHRIGDVEITHHQIGTVRRQSDRSG